MGRGPVRSLVLVVLAGALAAACGPFPRDPLSTTQQVRGAVLKVGVAAAPPFVVLDGPQAPGGVELRALEAFASSLDARVQLVEGTPDEILRRLEEGDVHVVAAGLQASTPWSAKVALTLPYLETPAPGHVVQHVLAVRKGENGFLTELERFLLTGLGRETLRQWWRQEASR